MCNNFLYNTNLTFYTFRKKPTTFRDLNEYFQHLVEEQEVFCSF